MNKRTLLLAGCIGMISTVCAQQPQGQINLVYKNSSYDVFTIRIDTAISNRFSIVENTALSTEEAYFQSMAAQDPFFCITAGIVDSTCTPLGLCIEKGQRMHDINTGTGNGNFFLKPNGILTIDSTGKARIVSQEDYKSEYALAAIQSGPMLLIKGKVHPAFDPKSKNKNIRCGVGISKSKAGQLLVFIKSNTAVSFSEFAEIFRDKYHCDEALNLESGPVCSMHLPTAQKSYSPKTKVCRYLYIQL